MKKGISLIVLIITIIIIIIISSIVIANLFGDNGILSNANRAKVNNNIAEKQDELNIAAGQALIEISKGNKSGEPTVSGDFVQPWYCDSFSVNDWNNHIKILKRAGINTIILQWTAEFSNNKIKYLGYESDLVKDNNNLDSSFDVNTYNQKSKYMLENLLKAAQNNNMKVYIGLSIGNDWWNNSFTNNDWCNSNAALTNKIANEIYNKYKINYLDTFVGWYWPWELYTTKNNYEVNWSYFLNMCLDNLTSLDSNMPMNDISTIYKY